MTDQCRTLAIRGDFIELYKVLKLENMAASGGEAKHMIAAGMVLVNGRVETRKRRKTVAGDVVEMGGERVRITAGR